MSDDGVGAPCVVLIVEDHEVIVQSLTMALTKAGVEVHSAGGPELDEVIAVANRCRPDVVVLDLHLGNGVDGHHLIGPLVALGAKVMVLTGTEDDIALARCVEAGCTDVVSKAEPFHLILDRVLTICRGGGMSPTRRSELLDLLRRHREEVSRRTAVFERLSRREREVLAALVEGKSAGAMAAASFVSLATVRTQIRAVLVKLGVTSQREAVAMAARSGWATAPGPETPPGHQKDLAGEHS